MTLMIYYSNLTWFEVFLLVSRFILCLEEEMRPEQNSAVMYASQAVRSQVLESILIFTLSALVFYVWNKMEVDISKRCCGKTTDYYRVNCCTFFIKIMSQIRILLKISFWKWKKKSKKKITFEIMIICVC